MRVKSWTYRLEVNINLAQMNITNLTMNNVIKVLFASTLFKGNDESAV